SPPRRALRTTHPLPSAPPVSRSIDILNRRRLRSEPIPEPILIPALPRTISGSTTPPPAVLTWSDELGKRIRRGGADEQAVSTVTRVEQAIDAGQWEPAAQLVDYFMEEAKVVFVIYTSWSEGFEDFLGSRGVSSEEVATAVPRTFDPVAEWLALGTEAGALANALRAFLITADDARGRLDALREGWRRLHDDYADYQAGLLKFVADRFGEAALGDCYRHVLDPYLRERYGPCDVRLRPYEDTVFRNAYVAYEAMRAHLCGPDRRGELEVEEDDDKI